LELRRQLDQMLLFSRFSPMLSFGRPLPVATWFSASAPSASAADLHRHEKFQNFSRPPHFFSSFSATASGGGFVTRMARQDSRAIALRFYFF